MQEASLFARSLTVQVFLSHLSMECVKYSLLWSEWVSLKPGSSHFSTFTLLKWNWNVIPSAAYYHSVSDKLLLTIVRDPKRAALPNTFDHQVSQTPYPASMQHHQRSRWWFWFLPQPSKSSSSLRKAGCNVWHNENVFYSKTLMSFFSNQEAKQRSTEEQCCF